MIGSAPDGSDLIATLCADGVVTMSAANGTALWRFATGNATVCVFSPAFSADGSLLFIAVNTSLWTLFAANGTAVSELLGLSGPITSFAVGPADVVIAGTDAATSRPYVARSLPGSATPSSVFFLQNFSSDIQAIVGDVAVDAGGAVYMVVLVFSTQSYVLGSLTGGNNTFTEIAQITYATVGGPVITGSVLFIVSQVPNTVGACGYVQLFSLPSGTALCGQQISGTGIMPNVSPAVVDSSLRELAIAGPAGNIFLTSFCTATRTLSVNQSAIISSPVVDGSSNIIVATSAGTLVAVSLLNTVVWEVPVPSGNNVSSASIGGRGVAYASGGTGAFAVGEPPCPPGSFLGTSGCLLCLAGSFNPFVNAPNCTLCAAGTASSVLGANSSATCDACAPGSSSPPGAPLCSACAAGSYSSAPGSASCLACVGTCFCPASSTSSCSSLIPYPGFAMDVTHSGLSGQVGPASAPTSVFISVKSGQASLPVSGFALGPVGGPIAPSNPYSALMYLGLSDDFFAVSSNGAIILNYDTPAVGVRFGGAPVVSPWGLVYVLASDYVLRAYTWNVDGGPVWTFYTVASFYTPIPTTYTVQPPTLLITVSNRTVVFAAGGTVYAVDAMSGAALWSFTMPLATSGQICGGNYCPIAVSSSPAVDAAGTRVFFGADDFIVRCLSAVNGTALWTHSTRGPVRMAPSVSRDGAIVFTASTVDDLRALDAKTGVLVWLPPTVSEAGVSGAPVVGRTAVFVGTAKGYVIAVNNSYPGSVKWSVPLASPFAITACMTLGANGTLYVGGSNGILYGLDEESGVTQWTLTIDEPLTVPGAIGADGVLYLPSLLQSGFYAIRGDSASMTATATATRTAQATSSGSATASATALSTATATSTVGTSPSSSVTASGSPTPSTTPSNGSGGGNVAPNGGAALSASDTIVVSSVVTTIVVLILAGVGIGRTRLTSYVTRLSKWRQQPAGGASGGAATPTSGAQEWAPLLSGAAAGQARSNRAQRPNSAPPPIPPPESIHPPSHVLCIAFAK